MVLPDIFCRRGIEDVFPTQEAPDSTRGTLNFNGTFSSELFSELFKTGDSNNQLQPNFVSDGM